MPADFPIQVDESALVAVVEGGVSLRVLLDYLAKHRCTPHKDSILSFEKQPPTG